MDHIAGVAGLTERAAMTDAFVRVPKLVEGDKIDNTLVRGDVYRQRVETYNGSPVNIDTSGRTRSSALLTLFDGKIMNAEDVFKWDTQGTGTALYENNAVSMSVAAGQYLIRQARYFTPYFSGKPQLIEITQQDFDNEPGAVKRFGYFSSSAVAPYDTAYDGWWIEADGTDYWLVTSNLGVETHRIKWTDWDGYSKIATYDWSKFTVTMVDFLWLGGAGLRFFMIVDGAFQLIHTIDNHAGYQDRLIFNSPNQPVRYEIRSTTGAGHLRAVCSQVATEGTGTNEMGEGVAKYSALRATNAVGTTYPLLGVRKVAAFRDHYIPVTLFGAAILTADSGVLQLCVNPTFSAAPTWAADSRIEWGTPAAGSTVTNPGRILKAAPIVQAGNTLEAPSALLRNLAVGIDNTMSELWVCYTPLTNNQSVVGSMQVVEY